MAVTAATDLKRLVSKLQSERETLVRQIEEIDATFTELGITASAPKRRGRKPGTKVAAKAGAKTGAKRGPKPGKKRGRKKRGSFAVSGEDSVLNFIKSAKNPTTAQVNEHWTKEGRGGKADNTISKLVKANKLKRTNIKGERGSKYKVA